MSIVARIASGALEAQEASGPDPIALAAIQRAEETARVRRVAEEMVKRSPLAEWFPVTWRLLHVLGPAVAVVTEDEDDGVELRFVVARIYIGDFPAGWRIALLADGEEAQNGTWRTAGETVENSAEVGVILRDRARQIQLSNRDEWGVGDTTSPQALAYAAAVSASGDPLAPYVVTEPPADPPAPPAVAPIEFPPAST